MLGLAEHIQKVVVVSEFGLSCSSFLLAKEQRFLMLFLLSLVLVLFLHCKLILHLLFMLNLPSMLGVSLGLQLILLNSFSFKAFPL